MSRTVCRSGGIYNQEEGRNLLSIDQPLFSGEFILSWSIGGAPPFRPFGQSDISPDTTTTTAHPPSYSHCSTFFLLPAKVYRSLRLGSLFLRSQKILGTETNGGGERVLIEVRQNYRGATAYKRGQGWRGEKNKHN